jgi:hypothetical protein
LDHLKRNIAQRQDDCKGEYLDRRLEERICPLPDDILKILPLVPPLGTHSLLSRSVTYRVFTKQPPSIPNESLAPLPFLAVA